MTTLPTIDEWVKKIEKSESAEVVFKLLKDFRKGNWNEYECAIISKAYMRQLRKTGGTAPAPNAEEDDEGMDGPVWYEKM